MKSALAIRHVYFEDLGLFEPVLTKAGYVIQYVDVDRDDLRQVDGLAPDLFVILGAPVGVYEEKAYPFLAIERELLARRLSRGLPTVGICLGAQQLAATLGATVAPSGFKEIGFAPIELTGPGKKGVLRHLEGVPVLHWHGDVLQLPKDAERLASTNLCANQAFAIGNNILGLQFHSEVDVTRIEAWLVGHAAELASAGIDPVQIRNDAATYGTKLANAATTMFEEWLRDLGGNIIDLDFSGQSLSTNRR
jgi:GMP synthase (glutamine-hydrolysing)